MTDLDTTPPGPGAEGRGDVKGMAERQLTEHFTKRSALSGHLLGHGCLPQARRGWRRGRGGARVCNLVCACARVPVPTCW